MTVIDAVSGQPLADADLEAREVSWDLGSLVDGAGVEGVERLLDQADAIADELTAARGKVADFDAAELDAHMRRLAELHELLGRAGSYASLRFAVDTAHASIGALTQLVAARKSVV